MNLPVALLTAGGLGMSRVAPGTCGSVPPVVFVLLILALGAPAWMISVSLLLLAVPFSIACVRFGEYAEARFGGKDPSQVVADEVAGQSIALLFLPWRLPATADDWLWNGTLAAVAFITFRIFDITKLPPARQIQRLPAGWGILADDLVAGVYALLLTLLTGHFFLPLIL